MVELTTIKALILLAPITLLLALGLWLTLGSGMLVTARGQAARVAFANFSRMVGALALYALALIVLQQMLGFPWR